MPLTITECLAELKTLAKRIEKKREAVATFIARQDGIKDPLAKDGGSLLVNQRELQAIFDLETRIVALRRGIAHANDTTPIMIRDVEMSISEWLTWRREIAPGRQKFLETLRKTIIAYRTKAAQVGAKTLAAGEESTQPNDIVVNIDEAGLVRDSEVLEDILGQLDGQLSLRNATTIVDV
jgi:hypothetical protein